MFLDKYKSLFELTSDLTRQPTTPMPRALEEQPTSPELRALEEQPTTPKGKPLTIANPSPFRKDNLPKLFDNWSPAKTLTFGQMLREYDRFEPPQATLGSDAKLARRLQVRELASLSVLGKRGRNQQGGDTKRQMTAEASKENSENRAYNFRPRG